ncbi:MAG: NADH-quinone oxidoreductase subunit J [Deltaproteobacteria bacterium]|nr:NADH-quinone oxidoreductase subunit J [Deltaproteobacteria bacterium]
MTPLGLPLYLAGLLVFVSTALAVTRRDPVHAVVWLIASFLGTALVFALLGAPVLAALQVILYAGGILVLFLFVVMTIRPEPREARTGGRLRRLLPLLFFGAAVLGVGLLVLADPAGRAGLVASSVTPRDLGSLVFGRYAVAVEVASILLFVPLVGALFLGREPRQPREETP